MGFIWGVFKRNETGEGSTGCCGALLDCKAFERDGILWILLSPTGSESEPLKDLSGCAEATGQGGIKGHSQKTQTGGILEIVNNAERIPCPFLDAIIFLRFTFCGLWRITYHMTVRVTFCRKKNHERKKVALTFSIKTDSSSSSEEGQSSPALFETLREAGQLKPMNRFLLQVVEM